MALNSYADISYEELLKKVGWISLGSEANQMKMKILFKNLTKIQERRTEFFQSIEPETARRASRLSHNKQLKINGFQPHLARTKQAAIPTMVKLWNSLPPEVINSSSIDEFTEKIAKTTLWMSVCECVWLFTFTVCQVLSSHCVHMISCLWECSLIKLVLSWLGTYSFYKFTVYIVWFFNVWKHVISM